MVISAVTSITRLSQGMSTAVASRYRLISIVFLLSVLIYFWELCKQKNCNAKYVNGAFLLISGLYLFFFNFNGNNEDLMSYRKRTSMMGALSYFSDDGSLLNSPKPLFCAEVLKKVKDSEVFVLNQSMIDNYYTFAKKKQLSQPRNEGSEGSVVTVETVRQLKDSYYIDGFGFIQDLDTRNQDVYLILNNNGQQYAYLATNEYRPGLSAYFEVPHVDYGGFCVRLKNEDINPGTNEVYVVIKNDETIKMVKTDKKIIKE